ncbi:TolB family protein [Aliikangiella coralliicola]|uniref:Uncharacterized protein n=1 Tax=Aliikangiella coralliicola TaxID=2592383 RepID=A0A545UCV4_9GAMM|nr:hypothetical protein [Aliikangiella coralliicola]TQV87292.1 hypothetical protein FLL46_12640 [Aliikangiella coralliicola]
MTQIKTSYFTKFVRKPVSILSSLLVLFLIACNNSSNNNSSTNTVTGTPPPLANIFKKYTNVFGITIYATSQTPNDKILHAANIMAEYLDNNEDGVVDNQQVVDRLKADGAALLMASNQNELESLMNQIPESDAYQDLYASEVFPNGASQGNFDASLEEVLHLITHVGFSKVYPTDFGEQAGSKIADAMDVARGGHFQSIPANYPDSAWYTYDDTTCNYSCMITEYTYWALTSILGAQEFPGRLEEIQNEWKLNTREKVASQDALVFELLTDQKFLLPTLLPDGNYSAHNFEITDNSDTTSGNTNNVLQAVQNANPGFKIAFGDTTKIYMMDPDGSNVEELADGSPISGYVAWGPQAKYVYFASAKGEPESAWEAFRVNTQTKALTQLSNFDQDVRSLGVSPDGKYIAISVMTGNSNIGNNNDNLTQFSTNLYIMKMADAESIWSSGGQITLDDMNTLVSSPSADQFWYEELHWNPASPDDDEEPLLSYTQTWRYDEDDVSYTHAFTIRADGTEQQLVAENKDQPIWNFAGDTLCFLDLSCINLTTNQSLQLAVSGINEEISTVATSPDGTFILFEVGDENRKAGIAKFSESTDNPGMVIENVNVYEPRWSPVPLN